MNLSLRRVKSSNGDRLIVLVDELGMPLFYPTLYVTVHMPRTLISAEYNSKRTQCPQSHVCMAALLQH